VGFVVNAEDVPVNEHPPHVGQPFVIVDMTLEYPDGQGAQGGG